MQSISGFLTIKTMEDKSVGIAQKDVVGCKHHCGAIELKKP